MTYNAKIIALLRDRGYLLDMGQGRKARLPIHELHTLRKGAKERALEIGSELQVRVIEQSKHSNRLDVVSERAEVFLSTLDRLEKQGWREQFPEPHSWHYRKGRWQCSAIWPTWEIRFSRLRSLGDLLF